MSDEKNRAEAILGCAEAQGRGPLARHIAFNTAMSAEDAKGMLSASAKVETAADREDAALQATIELVQVAGVRGYRAAQ